MSELVLQICGDAECLRQDLNKAGQSAEKFADNTEKKVTGRLNGAFNKLGSTIKNNLLPVFAIGGLIAGVSRAVKEAVEIINKFDTAVAELSAITGATGEDLDFFRQKAIGLGPQFAKSATEIVDAFKLVGSAQPLLLDDADALAKVTEQALLLSQASGDDLEKSVGSLTTILAQFNEPAERAGEIVNALAAGSKAGAAPVDQLAETLNRSGIILGQSNASTEEAIALAETLADKQLTGAEAGTALNAVFNRLNAAEALPKDTIQRLEAAGVNLDILGDTTLPVATRLRELSKIANDGTTQFKLFGEGGQKAGAILLQNVDRFEKLTEAVTGTNTAVEQAAIASQTLEFQTAKTDAAYESLVLSLDNGTGPLTETLVGYEKLKQSLFEFLTTANDATASNQQLLESLNSFTATFERFSGGSGVLSEAEKQLAGINATLDKYVEKTAESVFATEDLAIASGASAEEIKAASEQTTANIEIERQKYKELLNQVLTTSGAERTRAENSLELQQKVVDAIQAEVDAREQARQDAISNLQTGAFAGLTTVIPPEEEVADTSKSDKQREKQANERRKLEEKLASLRANALEDERERELALLELSFQKELETVEKSEEGKKLVREKFAQDQLDINRKFDELGVEQNASAAEFEAEQRIRAAEELTVELNRIELDRLEQRRQVLLNAGLATQDVDAQILEQRKTLAESELELEISKINKKAELETLSATNTLTNAEELADAELQIEIEKLEAIIAARKAAGESTVQAEQELANIRLGIRQQEVAREQEITQARKDAALELAGTLRDIAIASLQAQTEAQINSIEEEKDAELKAIDEKLEAENLSEAQREQLIQQRERIEREADEKTKKLQREQAERERAIATFEALINGAVAFTKALTVDPTGILAGITAAQTLAQIALINSQPLPEFAKGTNYSPEGMALVGEEGPEIVYLPRGSQVKTASETRRIMRQGVSGSRITNMMDEHRQRELYLKYETTNNVQKGSGFTDSNLLRSERQTQQAIYQIGDRIVDQLKKSNYKGRGNV